MSCTYIDSMNCSGVGVRPPPPEERGCEIEIFLGWFPGYMGYGVHISLSFVSNFGCGGPTSHKIFHYMFFKNVICMGTPHHSKKVYNSMG